jgi:DNA recombination protein RmuC
MDLSTSNIIAWLLGGILCLLGWLAYLLRRKPTADHSKDLAVSLEAMRAELVSHQMDGLLKMRESLDSANRMLGERLAEGHESIDRRMAPLKDIESRLRHLATQADNIERVGSGIAELSELLRPPQLRGALGEMFLENALGQILPKAMYECQYSFPDGKRVDAVVKISDKLLPIDSKFPLESFQRLSEGNDDKKALSAFNRTLKKHVDDIAAKYIQPTNGTTELAVMYIPSEAVYYQFVSSEDLDGLQYALGKRVIPSSPGHLYAFLTSLLTAYGPMNPAVGTDEEARAREVHRLAVGLAELAESLQQVGSLHGKVESSLRRVSGNLGKIRQEWDRMIRRLEHLREPSDEPDSELSERVTDRF